MQKIHHAIDIDAPVEKVWDTMLGDDTYREWTSVFSPTSTVETDWSEGSKILFLDGKGSGMVSRIARKIDNEFMSFKHLGEVHNGIEDLSSEQVSAWSGAMENYSLKDIGGKTELIIETDVTDDFKDYMMDTWPKALQKVKAIVERSHKEAHMH